MTNIIGRNYVDVGDIIMEVDLRGFKRHTKLHFNTPTFDKITRDEKANWGAPRGCSLASQS